MSWSVRQCVLVLAHNLGCCLSQPQWSDWSSPQPPVAGHGGCVGAVDTTGLWLCCSFVGRWTERLQQEIKVLTVPKGTLVADI